MIDQDMDLRCLMIDMYESEEVGWLDSSTYSQIVISVLGRPGNGITESQPPLRFEIQTSRTGNTYTPNIHTYTPNMLQRGLKYQLVHVYCICGKSLCISS